MRRALAWIPAAAPDAKLKTLGRGRAKSSRRDGFIRARIAKLNRKDLSPSHVLQYTVDYAAARDNGRVLICGGAGDGFSGGATPTYHAAECALTDIPIPQQYHPVKTAADAGHICTPRRIWPLSIRNRAGKADAAMA